MAQRGKQSFEKRQREADRQDRARQKEARRQERREAGDEGEGEGEGVDEAALMAEYGRLAERHAAGEVADERFTARKREIFEALGLETE